MPQADLFTAGLTAESRRRPGRPQGRRYRMAPCHACGQAFPLKRPEQVYCSRACFTVAARDQEEKTSLRELISCAQCQRSFDRPRGTKRRFCSGICRGAHAHTLRPMRITAYRCHACGAMFRPDGGRPALFCSRACAGLDRNPRPFLYRSPRRYVALARQILERDGYRCGLCGKRINRRQRFPHPRSGTIDHIVPRSAGGTDAPRNLQAAHYQCNSRRGAGGPAQLRMGGADEARAQ
jgi:hypothetical protein